MEELDRVIIRKLQEDLPLVKEPYKQIAEEIGISEKELLDKIKQFKKQKKLRRIGAILHHRTAGIKANAMVVWEVCEEKIEEAAKVMISFDEVSHCYQRQTLPNWPYTIYTMIHAGHFESCERVIRQIADTTHIQHYKILYSTKELKKSSMKYFSE